MMTWILKSFTGTLFVLGLLSVLGRIEASAASLESVLLTRLDEDIQVLNRAIEEKNLKGIWEWADEATRHEFGIEEFKASVDLHILGRIKNWKVGRPKLYAYEDIASQSLAEAYAIVIFTYEIEGKEFSTQTCWVFSTTDGHWKYYGMPLGFAYVPLALAYSGIPRTTETMSRTGKPYPVLSDRPEETQETKVAP